MENAFKIFFMFDNVSCGSCINFLTYRVLMHVIGFKNMHTLLAAIYHQIPKICAFCSKNVGLKVKPSLREISKKKFYKL